VSSKANQQNVLFFKGGAQFDKIHYKKRDEHTTHQHKGFLLNAVGNKLSFSLRKSKNPISKNAQVHES
jgi:hypothetical protein